MLRSIYSVLDTKALQYSSPFLDLNDDTAKRSFEVLANTPNTTVFDHPLDFSLMRIGTFNDANGSIEPCVPHHIWTAFEAKHRSPVAGDEGDAEPQAKPSTDQ